MHMYVELKSDSMVNVAMNKEILKYGTFAGYEGQKGNKLRHINPSNYEVMELLRFEKKDYKLMGEKVYNG